MRRVRVKNVSLVAAMAAKGMTGRELASRAGLSETAVSLLVNQRTDPKPSTITAIARALGVNPRNLFPEGGVR